MTTETGEAKHIKINGDQTMFAKDILLIDAVNPSSDVLEQQVERLSDSFVSESLSTGEIDLQSIQDKIDDVVVEVTAGLMEIFDEVRPSDKEIDNAKDQRIAFLTAQLEATKQMYTADILALNALYPNTAQIIREKADLQARFDVMAAELKLKNGVLEMQQSLLRNRTSETSYPEIADTPTVESNSFGSTSIRRTGNIAIEAANQN
jgi:hypothetical protein